VLRALEVLRMLPVLQRLGDAYGSSIALHLLHDKGPEGYWHVATDRPNNDKDTLCPLIIGPP